jgi:CheY-like chemotaxis protein
LAFSRRQVLKPEVVDLNEIILRMGQMLRRLVGEDIELKTFAAPALWKIKVDPGQIEQVIMNLVVNARDAMPDGGSLMIETGCIELDEEYALTHLGVVPGPHVMLAITDTGVGMSKAIQKRVFEPFFTTKETGKGTGLGLSMVFGIVNQSGGHIWLYSEPGNGTCVKIYLPRTSENATIRPMERRSIAPARHHETIQLCEDEDQVRTLARKILERRGYRVLEAARPLDAIAMVEAYGQPIDLLITDMVMPQMGGRELARRLTETRPEMKVLYMSGYTDNGAVNNGILDAGLAFIQKPIRPETFALKVRQILDGHGAD